MINENNFKRCSSPTQTTIEPKTEAGVMTNPVSRSVFILHYNHLLMQHSELSGTNEVIIVHAEIVTKGVQVS